MTEPCNARPRADETSIDTLNLDPFEFGFLSAARYFMVAFTGDQSAWINTVLNADAFFPGPRSAETMREALRVIQHMRAARRSCFRFSNPRCPCCAAIVTADERHLIQMVQHTRATRTSLAASSAMLLCEGHDVTDLLRQAGHFTTFASGAAYPARAPLH
ncbi:MAG: hypothetical protein AAGF60_02445 [Pseudomonadota bacterium]